MLVMLVMVLKMLVMLEMVGDVCDVGDGGDVGDIGDVGDGGYAPMTSSVPGSQSWLVVGITTRYCYITNDNGEYNGEDKKHV